jgi:hypothetical protein
MWGRMVSCGRVALGLPTSMQMPTRPSATRPQVANLPHIGALNLTHKYARTPAILQANPLNAHFYVARSPYPPSALRYNWN